MSFHSQTVKRKVFVCFSFVIAVFIAFGVCGIYTFERLHARFALTVTQLERSSTICLGAAESAFAFSTWFIQSALNEQTSVDRAQQREELKWLRDESRETVVLLDTLSAEMERIPAVRTAAEGWRAYADAVNVLYENDSVADTEAGMALALFVLSAARQAHDRTNALRAVLMKDASVFRGGDPQFTQRIRILYVCFFLFGIFFCVVAGAFLSVQIGEPAESMQKVVRDIMNMNESLEEIESERSRDEYLVFSDIIRLTKRGLRDNLTGLPTRALFTETLKRRLDSLPPDEEAAIYFIDMDNLKKINDTFGHIYGDEALKYFGTKLTGLTQNRDALLCRYGGDEFVVYVQGIHGTSEARAFGAEMVKTLAGHIEVDTRVLFFSASIGCALYPLHASDITVLIGMADKALYTAKQNGKFSCSLYDELTDEEE